jgi:hypothetical protein
MTTTEIRKVIADSDNSDWYNSVNVHIQLPHLDYDQTFTGFSSVYHFLEQQINGWDKFGEDIPSEFKTVKNSFQHLKHVLKVI